MKQVTITDIEFTSARIFTEPNGAGGVLVKVAVEYEMLANGDRYNRGKVLTLTGAKRTAVIDFFASLKTDLLAEEGI